MSFLLYPVVLLLRWRRIIPVVVAALLVMGCQRTPQATQPTPEDTLWLSSELSMTPAAYRLADSIYHVGWKTRTEQAICVTDYKIHPDGTVVIKALAPAGVIQADSTWVEYRCPIGPVIHTHLVENGWRYRPSPQDSLTTQLIPAPFQVLMSDSHSFRVVWRKKP